MCTKWVQRSCFFKPNKAQFNRVVRVISSDPDGIYSVKWLHLYNCPNGLASVESWILSTEENDCRFIEPSNELNTLEQKIFSSQPSADLYFTDWKYEQCKYDGGFSRYSVKSVIKKRRKTAITLNTNQL